MSDRGRTVLITGAAGGLGHVFATGFAERGYDIALADIRADHLAELAQKVRTHGVRCWTGGLDVTSVDQTQSVAQEVAEFGGGKIDVLVNNAALYGTLTRAPMEELDPDEWDRVMAVNVKGTWLTTRAVSSHLPDGGRVINIASATVLSGSAHWAHYVASKGAVIALTRVLAKELGARNITVNAVAPGFTLTDASLGLMEDASTYGVERSSIRRASEPEDITGAALFFASTDSDYITGQTLIVDGGKQFI